jgi:hypothetical protein
MTRPAGDARPAQRSVFWGVFALVVAGIVKMLYGTVTTLSIGVGGESAPFRRTSIFVGAIEVLLAASILWRPGPGRIVGMVVGAVGILGALVGTIQVVTARHGPDPGATFLMLGLLAAYGLVLWSLLRRGRGSAKGMTSSV